MSVFRGVRISRRKEGIRTCLKQRYLRRNHLGGHVPERHPQHPHKLPRWKPHLKQTFLKKHILREKQSEWIFVASKYFFWAPRQEKTWKMGYGLGFIGVIAHLLTIDPNFQRDIQVGCFSIPPFPSLEGMDLHKKPTFTPKLFSRELGGWGWLLRLLRLLRVCGWWFHIFFIFTPILEMIQFD